MIFIVFHRFTSGTIIPIGENGQPLLPAIMYNDSRAKEESYTSTE